MSEHSQSNLVTIIIAATSLHVDVKEKQSAGEIITQSGE